MMDADFSISLSEHMMLSPLGPTSARATQLGQGLPRSLTKLNREIKDRPAHLGYVAYKWCVPLAKGPQGFPQAP